MSPPGFDSALQVALGRWATRSVYAAVVLGVFEHLSLDKKKSAQQLAEDLKANLGNVLRILRVLNMLKFIDQSEDSNFTISESGAYFREDHPMSLKNFFLLEESEPHYKAYLHIPDYIKENPKKTAFEIENGLTWVEYIEQDPEYAKTFSKAMTTLTGFEAQAVTGTLVKENLLSDVNVLCDVGGGHGGFISAIVKETANTNVKGLVLEIPGVIDKVNEEFKDTNSSVTFVAGDMFKSVPSADVYFLKHILHDWPNAECINILKVLKKSGKPGSRVIACEYLIDVPQSAYLNVLADIHMLVATKGSQRTAEEFMKLYESAGLQFTGVLRTPSTISLVIGTL